jgi:hypothetical protein
MLSQFETMHVSNTHCRLAAEASQIFNAALLRGNLLFVVNGLLGRHSGLKTLPGFSGIHRQYSRGLMTVPIRRIVGSEGRNRDFDRFFHPLNEHVSGRWVNVAVSVLSGRCLPPVQLIELDDNYYIRDGHHRVSVASAIGQKDIEAQIIVWER